MTRELAVLSTTALLLSPLAAGAETFYFWRDADGRSYLTNEPARVPLHVRVPRPPGPARLWTRITGDTAQVSWTAVEDFATMPGCDREQQRRALTDRLTGEPANLAQVVQLADGIRFPSDKGRGYMDLEFFCFPAKHDPRQATRS